MEEFEAGQDENMLKMPFFRLTDGFRMTKTKCRFVGKSYCRLAQEATICGRGALWLYRMYVSRANGRAKCFVSVPLDSPRSHRVRFGTEIRESR